MTAIKYLRLDLTRRASFANAAQVGRSISADAENGMAVLASFRMECDSPAFARIRVRCIGNGTIGEGKDDGGKDEQGETGAYSASKWTRHLHQFYRRSKCTPAPPAHRCTRRPMP